ncbi:MAG: hypothetical protein PUI24_05370 [Spirochaetales bacterium]|nr:hypothetical protein [Spirochaetales bacterium]
MKSLLKTLASGLAAVSLLIGAVACSSDDGGSKPEYVAPVEFSKPDQSEISSGESVYLYSETENAEIYYTVVTTTTGADGEPVTEGTAITLENIKDLIEDEVAKLLPSTGAIEITKDCTVYAVAKSAGGKFSAVTSVTYTVLLIPTPVTFSPEDGLVAKNTKITLSSTSDLEGDEIKIYYSTDKELTKENYKEGIEYNAEAGITITGKTTIYAIAKGNNGCSAPSSKTYKIPLTRITELKDGDVICIGYITSATSEDSTSVQSVQFMRASENGTKIGYESKVTITDIGVAATEKTGLYTVKVNSVGQIMLINNGRYLTSGATGNALSLEETFTPYALWNQIEPVTASDTNSLCTMQNSNAYFSGQTQSLEFWSGFTTYNTNNSDTKYQFAFYKDENAVAEEVNVKAANVLADVTFDVEDKAEVFEGAYINLSCVSRNVDFYYKDSAFTDNSLDGATKAEGNRITASNPRADSYTIYVIAVLEGNGQKIYSAPAILTYTVKEYTGTVYKKVESLSSFESNLTEKQMAVVYCPSEGIVLSNTEVEGAKTSSLKGTEVTLLSKGIVYNADIASSTIYTVSKFDGGLVFINNGKFLTCGASSGLTLEDTFTKYAVWDISTQSDVELLLNRGANTKYLEYYNGFTTYTYDSSKNNIDIYTFELYTLGNDNSEGITADDTVVPGAYAPVINPASGSEVKSGTTVEITAAEGDSIYWQFIAADDTTTEVLSSTNYSTAGTLYGTEEGKKPTIAAAGTLYAIAVASDGCSNVVSATYTLMPANVYNCVFADLGLTASGEVNDPIKVDNAITLTFDKGNYNNNAKYNSNKYIQVYSGNTLTVATVDTSKKITKIEFTWDSAPAAEKWAPDSGAYDTSTCIWTPEETSGVDSVIFNCTATVKLLSVKITTDEQP